MIFNYWMLIAWLFIIRILFSTQSVEKQIDVLGKVKKRWRIGPALVLALPYVFWAAIRTDAWGDTGLYRIMFKNAPTSMLELGNYLELISKDKGFSVLTVLLKSLFGSSDFLYFLILASIQILIIVCIYRKYSCDYWLSMFIFIASTDYMSWVHNCIRQFTAVTLIFSLTYLILKKKYIPVIIVILLASTIHGSAILMLPIIFFIQGKAWNKKTIFCLILTVISVLYIGQFTELLETLVADTQYTDMVNNWQSWNDNGTNPIRVLVISIPTLLSIIGLKWIRVENDPIINMSVNASIISTALAILSMFTSGIFIGRLPIYCSLYASGILLPWEVNHMFTKNSASIVKMILVISYVLLFYYQMHVSWGIM